MENSSGLNYRLFDTVGASRRNKKRKPDETEFSSGLDSILRESEQFRKLREYERRLDAVITGRNLEVSEALGRVDRNPSVLRVYLWNEFTSAPSGLTKNLPFWKLKIAGRLLPARLKPGEVSQELTKSTFSSGTPFGYFLKGIEVDVEDEDPEQRALSIQWTKSRSEDDFKEVFEIFRPGEKEKRLKVILTMDHQAPLFRLNHDLAKLLGMEIGSRSKIINELWNYIRSKNLQSSKDPGIISLNQELKILFGEVESIQLTKISAKLDELLVTSDVVTLDYQLKKNLTMPVVYDIEMELPSVGRQQTVPQFTKRQIQDAEVNRMNQVIKDTAMKIAELKRRRHFFMGFSQNPTEFINALLVAQTKEVRSVKRLGGRECYTVETQTEFFKEKWVEDAVVKYFQRRLASGH